MVICSRHTLADLVELEMVDVIIGMDLWHCVMLT